ncbi:PilZ domain-containing protein [Marinobacterium aestuariivivens]|uniref:PilZ domain-containing protein n=1 Tax=Marinobacterium aestuariivivens TaxID=1698799 RepID=A0ABW1ZUJ7_9GAMM
MESTANAEDRDAMTPRRYIRHPSEIPIVIQAADQAATLRLKDFSLGGLCLHTDHCLAEQSEILIRIPLLPSEFEARGRVIWCHYLSHDQALLGICFHDPETAYAVRMVEQICHIESYRRRIGREQNRALSSEEAAVEWIARYARHFPQ